MKLLSDEKLKMLSEKHGWSIARARGYIDGETFRRLGTIPSTYALVAIDDYGLGFRAGYYVRTSLRLTRPVTPRPGAAPSQSDDTPQAFLSRSGFDRPAIGSAFRLDKSNALQVTRAGSELSVKK